MNFPCSLTVLTWSFCWKATCEKVALLSTTISGRTMHRIQLVIIANFTWTLHPPYFANNIQYENFPHYFAWDHLEFQYQKECSIAIPVFLFGNLFEVFVVFLSAYNVFSIFGYWIRSVKTNKGLSSDRWRTL